MQHAKIFCAVVLALCAAPSLAAELSPDAAKIAWLPRRVHEQDDCQPLGNLEAKIAISKSENDAYETAENQILEAAARMYHPDTVAAIMTQITTSDVYIFARAYNCNPNGN